MEKRSRFNDILLELPEEYRKEILETDEFLKSLRPLRFKRSIDKHGTKITYIASVYGVSYAFRVSSGEYAHELNWYIVYNGKPETWHRKADYMNEILDDISNTDPKLSEKIFSSLVKCNGCHGERCLARTPYSYNNLKKLTCHGRVSLGINHNDFNDAREFFNYLNIFISKKVANDDPLPEKIILVNSKRSL